MLLLLARMTFAPALIFGGSAAQRRFGQTIGGRLIGLPLTSLPLLVLLTISQGAHYAGSTAVTILAGGVAQSAWCLAYAIGARKYGTWTSLAVATGVFTLVCIGLYAMPLPPFAGALAAAISIVVALAVWPQTTAVPAVQAGASCQMLPDPGTGAFSIIPATTTPVLNQPTATALLEARRSERTELAVRMFAGAAFTLAVTAASAAVSAGVSGLLGAFPVLTVVLSVATQRRDGGAEAGRFLEGVMEGSLSVVAGIFVLAVALPTAGPLFAFPLAIAFSVAAQFVPLRWARTLCDRALGAWAGA